MEQACIKKDHSHIIGKEKLKSLSKNGPREKYLGKTLFSSSISCKKIFNDYIWSLYDWNRYARMYFDLFDKKLVEDMPKLQILLPVIPKFSIWCLNIMPRYLHLQWSSVLWDVCPKRFYCMLACVLTRYRIHDDLQDKKLVKNMPEIQILPSS